MATTSARMRAKPTMTPMTAPTQPEEGWGGDWEKFPADSAEATLPTVTTTGPEEVQVAARVQTIEVEVDETGAHGHPATVTLRGPRLRPVPRMVTWRFGPSPPKVYGPERSIFYIKKERKKERKWGSLRRGRSL